MLTYKVAGNERGSVYSTKEELKKAVEVIYEIMESDDTIRICTCGYVEMLDGTEQYHVIETFYGTERKVSNLLAKM